MAATYEPLATTTTTGGVTETITFNSISGSYTDLVIVANTVALTDTRAFRFRFNSDTGSNYSYLQMSGTGSAAASTLDTAQVSGLVSGSLMSTDSLSMFIMNIMNYSNTTTYKTTINKGFRAVSSSLAAVSACASLWRSTAAITRIDLTPDINGGIYIPNGSTFTLYGIKAA